MALEELWDGGSGAGFEVGVEVEKLPVEAGGEEAADGGFARSHEAGEDEAAEMGGDEMGAGLVVGHGLGCGLGWGFGLGGRHYLSLQVLRENERAAPFLGLRLVKIDDSECFRCFQRCMRGLHWALNCANR